ncbi:MAG: hypothetical protein FWH32_00110 [Clostridiales bacterium]|nr:hypothetical protein [Clostridiales bacterium]
MPNLLKNSYVILVIIIALQILMMIYYLDQKKGFHLDEFYSHSQANGQLTGAHARNQDNMYNNWHSSDYYLDILTVQPEERFDFKSVYQTISLNVHPPFYHMQIHAVHSLFPDTWSKWLAGSLNILWFIGASILLYLAAKLALKDRFLALLPNVIWGFTAGAISSVVYFRMYVVLTFFFVALIYLAMLIVTEKTKMNPKWCIALSLTLFFGFFTHHYIHIFCTYIAVLLLVWLLYKKEYGQLRNCVVAVAVASVAFYMCWPYAPRQILRSHRGTESIDNFFSSEGFSERLSEFLIVLNRDLFGGMGLLVLVVVIALLIACIITLISRKTKLASIIAPKNIFKPDCFVVVLLAGSVFYFLVITKVAPFTQRYLFAIYPVIILLLVTIANHALRFITKRFATVILVAFSASIILSGLSGKEIQNLYANTPDIPSIVQQYDAPVAIALRAPNSRIDLLLLDFAQFDKVYICEYVEYFDTALDGVAEDHDLFLYIDKALDSNEILENMHERISYNDAQMLCTSYWANVYYID